MKLNVMNVVYYSPTRTSQKVARAIAEGLGIARRQETDLTTDFRTDPIMVKDSICIVAAPVYGGLVAPAALERISRLRGENSVAIPCAGVSGGGQGRGFHGQLTVIAANAEAVEVVVSP